MDLAKTNKKQHHFEIDMTNGNFFKKIVIFCLPLIFTGILQLLYNAADLIVVGTFSKVPNALGAVGSTSALINLIVNLFMGLSVGANVMSASAFAAKDENKLSKIIHTSITVSVITGIFLGIIGFIFARQFLEWMHSPIDLIDLAVIYLKIYFLGMPFNMLYNFAASILRGVGDTKRPLIFLSIAGMINVVLNIVFVVAFKMDVDGVAIATVISQIVSCILIMSCLCKTKEIYHFSFKKIAIHKKELGEIIKIGLPAGIQSSIFSISNVIIQTSVNQFGSIAVNGNSAAQSIEGFVYISMNAVYHAALAFVGQNIGVKKYNNIPKITWYCLAFVSMVGIILGGGLFLLGRYVTMIYTTVPEEIDVSLIRLHYLCLPYFLCGIMDVMVGILRGFGYSVLPMIVSILGVCGFRILWIYTIFYQTTNFADPKDLHSLYISYPISWIVTFLVHYLTYIIVYKRKIKQIKNQDLKISYQN